jgi:8-oxo-dGTP diphosphatase
MEKTKYVCGFYFDHVLKQVVLIWKNKPAWQAGKLNGIGGKIEPGETAAEAMHREFKEETGIDHPAWDRVIIISGNDWEVHFFSAVGKANEFEYATTMEDEEVAKIEVDRLHDFDYIPNLEWLIPLALHKIEFPQEQISFT